MDKCAHGLLKTGKRRCLFMIVLLLSACSSTGVWQIPPATPLFEIPPTPVLELAGTYIAGQNDIPAGKYLAVEAWSNSDGRSSNGICPYAAMIDFPMYGMSSAELESYVEPQREYQAGVADPQDLSKVVGFFGMGSSRSGDMGGGASSRLLVIESLPTSGDNSIFVIQSAAADGTIVVQIDAQAYRLKPGQSWVENIESQPDENCHLLDTTRFTNYGLLDGSQIQLVGSTLAPGPTPTP
jgi:hypothetical protein